MDFAIGRGSAELSRRPHAGPKLAALADNRLVYRDGIPVETLSAGKGGIPHHSGRQEPVGGRKTAGAICRTRHALPPQLKSFQTVAVIEQRQRDEHEALKEAIPDLIRLERYERRAWSRQRRAIREFLNIKFTRKFVKTAASKARDDAVGR
jgi:hypothetical protein